MVGLNSGETSDGVESLSSRRSWVAATTLWSMAERYLLSKGYDSYLTGMIGEEIDAIDGADSSSGSTAKPGGSHVNYAVSRKRRS